MSTRTWSGAVSALWNVAGNWVEGVVPSAGDDLVFPLSPAGNKSNSNDFAADTAFNSITIQGNGYTLAGNRITLGAGGITQTTGTNTISLAIVLGAAVTVDVAGTTLALSGIISDGGGGHSVTKTGTKDLQFGSDNTFSGGLIIKAGLLITYAIPGTGTVTIGDTSGTATATLYTTPAAGWSNPIAVASGSSGVKAITGRGTLSGAITLADSVTISPSNTLLTLSGGITGTGNVIVNCNAITYSVTLSTTAINHTGTITNQGTGTGTTTISAVIGTNVTAVTQSSATSKLIISGAGVLANASGKLAITSGALQIGTGYTLGNLFVDGTAHDGSGQLILAANQTVTAEAKFLGAAGKQLLVTSDTLGTARTITVTGATCANCNNVDFRDITFSGSASFNFGTAIGDCGGNTFPAPLAATTADDWYWYSAGAGTYNLSNRAYWFDTTAGTGTQMGANRGPLPQDMLYVDGSSINGTTTIDQDMPRMPGVDFTGCDAVALHLNNVDQDCYGSLIFSSLVSVVSSTKLVIFSSRSSVVFTPPPWTAEFAQTWVNSIGGTVLLAGPLYAKSVVLYRGGFDSDAYNLDITIFTGTGTLARTLAMGSGSWRARIWDFATTTNLTSTSVGETSTIVFGSATDSTASTFAGGGLTYNSLSIVANTTGTQIITITGNNTFTGTVTHNGPKTVKWTAGSVTTFGSFSTTGTGVVIASTTPGSVYYFVDAAGTNQVSNATISDCYVRGSDAGGGALWDANVTRGNVDGSNNEDHVPATKRGWKFTGFGFNTLLKTIALGRQLIGGMTR